MNDRILLVGLLTIGASLCPVRLAASEWRIPLAGNSFVTQPSAARVPLDRDGSLVLRDPGQVVSVFFRVDRPASLQVSLAVLAGQEPTLLSANVQQLQRQLQIPAGSAVNHEDQVLSIGELEVSEAGYVRVDLQLRRKVKDPARMQALRVRCDAEPVSLAFVESNEGNMFYWGRRGPSVHLSYRVPSDREIQYAYSEIRVPEGFDPIGSYFMANGFAEGYFGMQVNSENERRILFSVWSPFRTDNPEEIPAEMRIKMLARGPGVHVGKFGNEGSGGQSYLRYPWQAGRTYGFLTEVKPDGQGSTVYSAWFRDLHENEWRLIATFRRPMTDTHYQRFHSFLENFSPTYGHLERKAGWGNVWVRDTAGQWHACTQARFTVDATGAKKQRLDFAGGADGKTFFMRNGGFFDSPVAAGTTFDREGSNDPPQIDLLRLPRQ